MDIRDRNNYARHLLRILYGGESPAKSDRDALKFLAKLEQAKEFDAGGQYRRLLRSVLASEKRQTKLRARVGIVPYAAVAAGLIAIVAAIGICLFSTTAVVEGTDTPLASLNDRVLRPYSPGSSAHDILLCLTDGRMWRITEDEVVIRASQIRDEIGSMAYDTQATVIVPKTRMASIELGDGTVVDLNSDTSVSFALSGAAGDRSMVVNEGEVYLDVAKDPGHPFALDVGGAFIRVPGTQFNINVRSGRTIATLVEGCIELRNKESDAQLRLRPGEQAVVKGRETSISTVEVRDVASWKEGKYVFKSQPLKEILDQVTRWYGVEFSIESPHVSDQSLTGVIYKNYTIDFVLRLIEEAADVHTSADEMGHIKIYR